jgi:hypothetical protein
MNPLETLQSIVAIGDRITEADADAAIEALRSMLTATTSIRIPNGKGGYEYKEIGDPKAVIPAAKILLEFKFGRARQEIKHSGNVGHVHATATELLERAALRLGHTSALIGQYSRPTIDIPAQSIDAKQVVDLPD